MRTSKEQYEYDERHALLNIAMRDATYKIKSNVTHIYLHTYFEINGLKKKYTLAFDWQFGAEICCRLKKCFQFGSLPSLLRELPIDLTLDIRKQFWILLGGHDDD